MSFRANILIAALATAGCAAPSATPDAKLAAVKAAAGTTSTDPNDVALFKAVNTGDVAAIQSAIAAGGSLTARKAGNTPLQLTAGYGYVEATQALLAAGADPNLATDNADHLNPLMNAVIWGQIPTAKLLIDAKADINARDGAMGAQAIHWALMKGCKVNMLKLLLSAGADAKSHAIKSTMGTAHMVAQTMNPEQTIKAIDQVRPYVPASVPFLHQTAADYSGPGACAAVLLDAGADPNEIIGGDIAPLHLAASFGHGDVITEFARRKVDLNARHRTLNVSHLVEKNGVKPATGTALMFAAYQGSLEAVQALVEAGADLTPTIRWQEGHVLDVDVNSNAAGTTITKHTQTTTFTANALSLAADRNQTEVVAYLQSKGAKAP